MARSPARRPDAESSRRASQDVSVQPTDVLATRLFGVLEVAASDGGQDAVLHGASGGSTSEFISPFVPLMPRMRLDPAHLNLGPSLQRLK